MVEIILRNEIPGKTTCSKLQVFKNMVIKKKVPFQKLMQFAPMLTSEPSHIHNPRRSQNLGIF